MHGRVWSCRATHKHVYNGRAEHSIVCYVIAERYKGQSTYYYAHQPCAQHDTMRRDYSSDVYSEIWLVERREVIRDNVPTCRGNYKIIAWIGFTCLLNTPYCFAYTNISHVLCRKTTKCFHGNGNVISPSQQQKEHFIMPLVMVAFVLTRRRGNNIFN